MNSTFYEFINYDTELSKSPEVFENLQILVAIYWILSNIVT